MHLSRSNPWTKWALDCQRAEGGPELLIVEDAIVELMAVELEQINTVRN